GDCSVLKLPDDRLILIDVGSRGSPVVDWLVDRHPSPQIAAIVLTHNDADHVGALPSILDNHSGRVEKILMLQDRRRTDSKYKKLLRRVIKAEEHEGTDVECLLAGMTIWQDEEKGLVLRVIFPRFTDNQRASNPNNTSGLIVLESNGDLLCVWPGDLTCTKVAEKLNGSSPELMIGPHHGAPQDLGRKKKRLIRRDEFRAAVSAISAERLFISVGTNNQHSHPRPGYLYLSALNGCRVVCSEISNACDREHLKSEHPVFDGSGALGLRACRTGVPCRGSWRARVIDGELIPDEFSSFHLEEVAGLKRPQCLKGAGWKPGQSLPW
ncbi:MAG: MBL fold metallo-hydrolase, partial [Verrucomicrobiales bacterium]|nr:MBL fold metallo-hydrolase [Verrucomicrobiales bacterium]